VVIVWVGIPKQEQMLEENAAVSLVGKHPINCRGKRTRLVVISLGVRLTLTTWSAMSFTYLLDIVGF
jgi:hypothetical protein